VNHLYNIFIKLIDNLILPFLGLFSDKIKRFQINRISLLEKIKNEIKKQKNIVWFHAASLGEYEIAVPLIKKIKEKYSSTIILTFFSESGFKLKDRIKEINHTFYLPLDTKSNARKFIDILNPEMVFFVKSEIWPNYLNEIKKRNIKTYLVESSFKKNDRYFKNPTRLLFINKLKIFDKIFTIDEESKRVLNKESINNVELTESLKIERVSEIAREKYYNTIIEKFKEDKFCIVCGSTWEKDEKIIFKYIEKSKNDNIKWIIAPHDVSKKNIQRIKRKTKLKYSIYSDISINNVHGNILILDTIGQLKNIYKYSDVSYVGGGMGKTGLHNILEACIFEIPVVIGKNYQKFKESIELVNLGAVISIKNQLEFDSEFDKLIKNEEYRFNKINKTKKYFKGKTGATNRIIKNLTL